MLGRTTLCEDRGVISCFQRSNWFHFSPKSLGVLQVLGPLSEDFFICHLLVIADPGAFFDTASPSGVEKEEVEIIFVGHLPSKSFIFLQLDGGYLAKRLLLKSSQIPWHCLLLSRTLVKATNNCFLSLFRVVSMQS